MSLLIAVVGVAILVAHQMTSAQARVDINVVYGMCSGLGLLMDVYRPAQPNGIAIVAVQGSGWYSPLRYDAAQLKASREVTRHAERFAAAGYTVFAINASSGAALSLSSADRGCATRGALRSLSCL